ncbi:MAG: hypothetical protein ACU841_13330, partial [Gammaproteobacteria bacterium]
QCAGNFRLDLESDLTESPTDRPNCVQRQVLKTLLSRAGWSHSLATDEAHFAKELHSGHYTSYLLLSKQVKLAESVQKELREAIYRGEGLIEAGSHDQRQGRIDDILGIKFIGKQSGRKGITILNSDIHPVADAVFSLSDKTLKASAPNATILGLYKNSNVPAVTSRRYGAGVADYFGFDLLAEASVPGADPVFSELLLGALEHVHPLNLKPVSGGIYPLQLSLVNQGIGSQGQAVMTFPSGVNVIDPGTAKWVDDRLIWPFEWIADQSLTFDSWISLPNSLVEIKALIRTGVSPNFADTATAALAITPESSPTPADLIADARVLDMASYKRVIKYLKRAEQDQAAGDDAGALASLIRASDALIDLGSKADPTLRTSIAEAMRAIAQKL